ncbi:hypothetical protein D1816_17650 [Aquimarina sp. AD10]|uniref:hypothetical protein n=1 Tax=Aquimarina TaxID=290174 RepID=UPI000E4E913A|nr:MULTISPECIES: hypothetical protein [Aquimarina]AXT62105.1 hypothetical protein D1816_17650 [Aquimarina sp. AD10]RKM99907.1 hypothetical protein D7033_09930 [Aquimarina sp. AD10]
MKKLFLLAFVLCAGLSVQAQEDTWRQQAASFTRLYELASELNDLTENVVAQGSVVSVVKKDGTISVEQKLDPSKPKEKKFYKYNLLTSTGRKVPLDLANCELVIERFYSKLLQVKESMRVNHDQDVNKILGDLFN